MRRMTALIGLSLCLGLLGTAMPAFGAGDYIVVLKDGVSPTQAARRHGAAPTFTYWHALTGYAATLTDAALARAQADPLVLFISRDTEFHTTTFNTQSTPIGNGEFVGNSITRVGGLLSPTAKIDGIDERVNVNVAVLDTGIDFTHPDLNVVGGVDCTSGQGFNDPNGHGTLVAGLIGEIDNNFGFVGVAPGANLWAVRVMDKNGTAPSSHIICGIDWVTSTRTDADPSNDIAVANMSIIGPGSDDGNCGRPPKNDPLHLAICNSVSVGVTYVVAAGNDSTDFQTMVPAAYDEVLTATAMGDSDGQPGGVGGPTVCDGNQADDVFAHFSNFATLPADQGHTVAAPGVCNSATYPGGLYAFGEGTSFASPIVAGTVALCIASGQCAGLTPAQIVQKIVGDAKAYNLKKKNASYGFVGDPLRPQPGMYFGFLIRAALY